jgi:DNA-binding MarR family transcriptional regulator
VDRLEAEGLVKREPHPTDRRASLVSLTKAGRGKIRPASLKHAQRMADVVSVLTAEEQQELVRLMKKLGKHAMQTRAVKEPVEAG